MNAKTMENDYTMSPRRMATILNNYFVQKVNNICLSLLPCNLDPTKLLKKTLSNWSKIDSIQTLERIDSV